VPVPGNETNTIYVWFDALVNYISAVGFPNDKEKFQKYWPADIHIIGKDITRFHCIIWPAMLMSAGLPLPKRVFGHSFVYVKGEKMSKTTNNVIDPFSIADKYSTDALRYFLLREIAFDNDGDFSIEKFIERYNSDLANDLGNLLYRTINMINIYLEGKISPNQDKVESQDNDLKESFLTLIEKIEPLMNNLEFHNALALIWDVVKRTNTYIEQTAPWLLSKASRKDRLKCVIYNLAEALRILSVILSPFIPDTSKKIWQILGLSQYQKIENIRFDSLKIWNFIKDETQVRKEPPIFPRIKVE